MKKAQPGDVAHALEAALISPNVSDSNFEPANVVDVIHDLARSIGRLGTGSNTQQGAIELLAGEIKEGSTRIASAIEALAEAIANTKPV